MRAAPLRHWSMREIRELQGPSMMPPMPVEEEVRLFKDKQDWKHMAILLFVCLTVWIFDDAQLRYKRAKTVKPQPPPESDITEALRQAGGPIVQLRP